MPNFRERYLNHDEITRVVRGWAEAYPGIVRLESIGLTPEGRDIWFLTIGPEPDRLRPAAWVDGNMHAMEVCGSSVALAIAEDAISLHLDRTKSILGLPAAAANVVREVLFYVVPRMSPDGAEAVLQTGRPVRSTPRLERHNRLHPRWVSKDIDGDGKIRLMRVEDPSGELATYPEIPGLLLPRELGDPAPFYKVYLEGEIANFDGHNVPSPVFLDDNDLDFNRNFPFEWAPTNKQVGAGRFPLSAPETRAIAEAAEARPHLFAWLNLHTFGGVFIRPLGDKPDTKMNPEDLALYRQLGEWAEELTSYPMVSGFEEFTYEPDTPIRGDLTEFAYHQLGCLAYVVELWDLFAQVGLERKRRFVDNYTHLSRGDLIKIAEWDRDTNRGRILGKWEAFDHPQLGRVEIGGPDPRVGMWNPPFEKLGEVCERHSAHFLRVAALAPRLSLRASREVGSACIRVEIANLGYLPTNILASAAALHHNEPLHLSFDARGCELVEPRSGSIKVGHLRGWGRGLGTGIGANYYLRTEGTTGRRSVAVTVKGHGTLTIRAGSCRVGFVERTIEV